MEYKEIEQLLERYWQCETSLKEEAQLRDFFSQKEVPAHLRSYKELFVFQQIQHDVKLGKDFDARVLSEIGISEVQAKRVTLVKRFIPLLKAIAVIAVILTLGNVVQQSFSGNDNGMLAVDTIGKQVNTPSVAISTDSKADQVLTDSLAKVKRTEVSRK